MNRLGLLILSSFLALAGPATAAEYAGTVDRVVDGDTLWVCDEGTCHKIRLCGIDTPERGEAGFRRATNALKLIALTKVIRCVQVGSGTPCDSRSKSTNRDRIVAQCFLGDLDIADLMVRRGSACDWTEYSGGHYSKGDPAKVCGPR